ncbi:MAG: hypothetical protein EXR71_13910 [Myxococcales bacterium]|nr:hypothetical protein [Myxococcales bacterium]
MARELRTCPVTGVVVLINDAWPDAPLPAVAPPGPCWACGNPGPVLARRGKVMAVPHPVPALGVEGEGRAKGERPGVRRDAVGVHELLFGGHDDADPDALLLASERVDDLRQDHRLRGFSLLRRAGPGRHPVWELFAIPTDLAPTDARTWRADELLAGRRVLTRVDGAVAIAAWAPMAPFEVWVLPESGEGDFPVAHRAVSQLAERVLVAMAGWLGGPEVRVTVEWGTPWRMVLRPRLLLGLATDAVGLPGHGVFPERAALELRSRLPVDG